MTDITPYHAKYFAHELSILHANNGVDRLSQSLFDASVVLNPHQIEAALFAIENPLSKGVVLADEVYDASVFALPISFPSVGEQFLSV